MCDAISVLIDKGEQKFVKCSHDEGGLCYYHAKMSVGLISPVEEERITDAMIPVRVELNGRTIWQA